MNVLICAAGEGAGEASLAVPVAEALRSAGHRVNAVTDNTRNADLLARAVEDCRVVDWAGPWWSGLAAGAASAVIASSSLTCAPHLGPLARQLYPSPIVCLEFSWVPWYDEERHGVVDAFVMPYPRTVVTAGLLGQGGDFAFTPGVAERVHAAGWFFPHARLHTEERLSVRRRLGVDPDARLVVAYPSRPDGFETVRPSLESGVRLLKEYADCRQLAVVLARTTGGSWPKPFQAVDWLPASEFHALCASADLVVGAGLAVTIMRALRAGVPSIIWSLPWDWPHHPWGWGEREAHAAHNAGLVQRLSGPAPPSAVAQAIHAGLCDSVLRREQLRAAGDTADGARAVVNLVEDLVALGPHLSAIRTARAGRRRVAANRLAGERHARAIGSLARYLADNDEPLKILSLLHAVPHLVEDHDEIARWDLWADTIRRHVGDPDAYGAFYQDDRATGAVSSPERWLDPEACLPRARWAIEVVRQRGASSVIDIGADDGIIAVPLLRACPRVRLVAVEGGSAHARLRQRLGEFGGRGQARTTTDDLRPADVVICFEVIEHVPDPVAFVRELRGLVGIGGCVLLSTPWGAYDGGFPPRRTAHGTPRDSRGHLRALTPRAMTDVLDEAGLDTVLLLHVTTATGLGEGMHVMATPATGSPAKHLAFVVTGKTATSGSPDIETVLGHARNLATDPNRRVEVYCPTGDGSVSGRLRTWPLAQVRHLRRSVGAVEVIVVGDQDYADRLRQMLPASARLRAWAAGESMETDIAPGGSA